VEYTVNSKYRCITGTIHFVAQRDGRPFVRGREWVRYDYAPDGTIDVQAVSTSDDPSVRRTVCYKLARDYRPREAFVRIEADGTHEGSGWFRFSPGRADWHAFNVRDGSSSGSMPIRGEVGGFCAHPVSTDALLCAAYDRTGASTRQTLENVYSSSPDPYGRVGPRLTPESIVLQYAGRESLDTPAGPLSADRYVLSRAEAPDVALQHLWCLADTSVFLRSRAAGTYGTTYELVELQFS
jgi:hypothetical protein